MSLGNVLVWVQRRISWVCGTIAAASSMWTGIAATWQQRRSVSKTAAVRITFELMLVWAEDVGGAAWSRARFVSQLQLLVKSVVAIFTSPFYFFFRLQTLLCHLQCSTELLVRSQQIW